jgi:hypothetical protein
MDAVTAVDQAAFIDDLEDGHAQPFHHGAGGAVVHLSEGDDFVVAAHPESVVEPGSSDLSGEPLSSCRAEQGPAEFQPPLPIDHGQAESGAPDEGAVGPSVRDPLPHPVGLPLASHLRGRRCRLFR